MEREGNTLCSINGCIFDLEKEYRMLQEGGTVSAAARSLQERVGLLRWDSCRLADELRKTGRIPHCFVPAAPVIAKQAGHVLEFHGEAGREEIEFLD